MQLAMVKYYILKLVDFVTGFYEEPSHPEVRQTFTNWKI